MKLKPDFVIHSIGDETLMVPTGEAAERFHGIVRLNDTAAFILEQLQKETTEAAVVQAVLDAYEIDRPHAEREVEKIVEKLKSIDALM